MWAIDVGSLLYSGCFSSRSDSTSSWRSSNSRGLSYRGNFRLKSSGGHDSSGCFGGKELRSW